MAAIRDVQLAREQRRHARTARKARRVDAREVRAHARRDVIDDVGHVLNVVGAPVGQRARSSDCLRRPPATWPPRSLRARRALRSGSCRPAPPPCRRCRAGRAPAAAACGRRSFAARTADSCAAVRRSRAAARRRPSVAASAQALVAAAELCASAFDDRPAAASATETTCDQRMFAPRLGYGLGPGITPATLSRIRYTSSQAVTYKLLPSRSPNATFVAQICRFGSPPTTGKFK